MYKTVLSGSSRFSLLPRRAALVFICGRLLQDLSLKRSAGSESTVGCRPSIGCLQWRCRRTVMDEALVESSLKPYAHFKVCFFFFFYPCCLRIMFISAVPLFYCDPISFPHRQPQQLTNAWSHVEEAVTERSRWCFLSKKRDLPEAPSEPPLFVVSVRRFPWLKTKAKERMRNMHF